ncbi:MAG: hypothetical protein ACKO46_04935 [Alphaproteobacteria bacterium]
MKINKLKKQLTISLALTMVMLSLIGTLIFMYFYLNSTFLSQYDSIIMEIANIKNRTSEIEKKSLENKKYMQLWSQINESKKSMIGIKVEDIKKIIDNLAEKYSISNTTFKVSVPENYSPSVYKNETISILYTIVELTYNSYHDVKAIQFANEVMNNIHGYPIVTKFEIFKDKDYVVKDYFDISTGKIFGSVRSKLVFSWYVYKEGAPLNSSTNKTNQ